jgi:hypothetical protein
MQNPPTTCHACSERICACGYYRHGYWARRQTTKFHVWHDDRFLLELDSRVQAVSFIDDKTKKEG